MADGPTYFGQSPDLGRIQVGKEYPGEGYAILRCGNTEIKIGYTLLGRIMLDTSSEYFGRDMHDLQRAINSITCEASLGRTGDQVSATALVKKIAAVSTAVGFGAGEPAMEIAGQIVSVLATNPEHIDRFVAEGQELFLDGTLNHENGSLTYRSIGGEILHPSVLRKAKGMEQ